MVAEPGSIEARAWTRLDSVPDPEMPALSIIDLGIVRAITLDGACLLVTITPTYSACPALAMIETTIRETLDGLVTGPVEVRTVLSPAWSSDWLSEAAKGKLVADGIAAPHKVAVLGLARRPDVPCPRCSSARTGLITQFSGTSCKALYRCLDCLEPFDYFKPH